MNVCQSVSLLCALSLLSCASSEANRGVRAADAATPMAAVDSGATKLADAGSAMESADPSTSQTVGTVGVAQCVEDTECMRMAQRELEGLTSAVPNAHVFESGVCMAYGLSTDTSWVSGPACECNQADSGSLSIGPAGAGCYAYGRLGDCLFGDDDFSYCELGETSACSALCAKLQARLDADGARTHTGEVKYATCDQYNCHNVLQVDGRCYADQSYQTGRDYDCALSGAEILAQHEQSTSKKPTGEAVPDSTWYSPDANGSVSIVVSTQFIGTKAGIPGFGTMAQLYSVSGSGARRADIVDPLEGADDCGVRRDHNEGTSPVIAFLSVDSAVLIDGDAEVPFELSSSSNGDFYSYGIELAELGVTPRCGGTYGFRAVGGTFGERVSVTGIELPEPLSIRELALTSHIERGPLKLSWTGRGSNPLRLQLYISPQPLGSITYTLECLVQDDGEFEIPDAVMRAVPNGIARAVFQRENRVLLRDGTKAILTRGSVEVMHELAYGDRCEKPAVVDACKRYADKMQQVHRDCAREAPPRDELCPEYIADACTLCPEYYACMARTTTCTNNQITIMSGCGCPK